MSIPLRVLIVEDSEDDALLLLRALRHGGYNPEFERVETAATMKIALARQTWDIIISDYSMPYFSGPAALLVARQSRLDLPFIVLSGAIGEETAVEVMKAGAHDYIMKDNPARLIPAIRRELSETEVRRERRQAEEETRKFKNIADRAGYGVAIADMESKLVYVNKSYARMHGYMPDKLIDRHFSILYPEEQVKIIERLRKRLVKEGGHWTEEIWRKRKDGTVFPTITTALMIKDDEGKPQYVTATAIDITERKQAEEALRESEERYRDLFENANDLIQSVAPDGHFIYVNRAWHETLGYTREEIGGLSLFDIIHPDSMEHCMAAFQQVMSGVKVDRIEAAFTARDGRKISVEGSAHCKFIDGKPVATRAIFRDITERKQAEDTLRESEARQRAILQAAKDAIISIDSHGNIVSWNRGAQSIYGYSADEVLGKSLTVLMPERSRDAFRMAFAQMDSPANLNYMSKVHEITSLRKDDSEFSAEMSLASWETKEGTFYTCILRDITERKRMEEDLENLVSSYREQNQILTSFHMELEKSFTKATRAEKNLRKARNELEKRVQERTVELAMTNEELQNEVVERKRTEATMHEAKEAAEAANRAKSEFLARMSHEIRTPIHGIMGMLELILDTALRQEQREYLDIADSSVNSLLAVINNILDFSKIEAGQFKQEDTDFDLRTILEHTVETLALAAHRKGLELSCHLPPEIPTALVGDVGHLR